MSSPDRLPLSDRPPPEPWIFWARLLAGAIALHALALAAIQQAAGRTLGTEQARSTRPLPIEFANLPPRPGRPAAAIPTPAATTPVPVKPPQTAGPTRPQMHSLPAFRPLSPEQLAQGRAARSAQVSPAPPANEGPVFRPSLPAPLPIPGEEPAPEAPGPLALPPPLPPLGEPAQPAPPNPGNPPANPPTPGRGLSLSLGEVALAQGSNDLLQTGDLSRSPVPLQTEIGDANWPTSAALVAELNQPITLAVAVGPQGTVLAGSVRVLTPGLSAAAIAAATDLASRLRFDPAIDRQGRAIAVNVNLTIRLR